MVHNCIVGLLLITQACLLNEHNINTNCYGLSSLLSLLLPTGSLFQYGLMTGLRFPAVVLLIRPIRHLVLAGRQLNEQMTAEKRGGGQRRSGGRGKEKRTKRQI